MLISLHYLKRFGCIDYIEWNCYHLDNVNKFDFKTSSDLSIIKVECMTQNNLQLA